MADTPTVQLPIDLREQPVLDQLLAIRASLTLLKQDRSTYVKSSDVILLYDKVTEQVQILNELRSDHPREENRGWSILHFLLRFGNADQRYQWIECWKDVSSSFRFSL
jgi:ABC-type sulfate transport system substrate-binding protein